MIIKKTMFCLIFFLFIFIIFLNFFFPFFYSSFKLSLIVWILFHCFDLLICEKPFIFLILVLFLVFYLFFFCFFQFLDNRLNFLLFLFLICWFTKDFLFFFAFFLFVFSFKISRTFRLVEISYDVIKNLNICDNVKIVKNISKMIWFILKMIFLSSTERR